VIYFDRSPLGHLGDYGLGVTTGHERSDIQYVGRPLKRIISPPYNTAHNNT